MLDRSEKPYGHKHRTQLADCLSISIFSPNGIRRSTLEIIRGAANQQPTLPCLSQQTDDRFLVVVYIDGFVVLVLDIHFFLLLRFLLVFFDLDSFSFLAGHTTLLLEASLL